MAFNVVFRSKPETIQPGIITWTCFANRETFLEKIEEYLEHEDIVAMGVSDDEAVEITRTTPSFLRFYAALHDSFTFDGTFSMEKMEMNMYQATFITGVDCPDSIIDCAVKIKTGQISKVPPLEHFYPN